MARKFASHAKNPGSIPGAATNRGDVEGAGILRLSFKQDHAGSIPVVATNFYQDVA